MQEFEATLAPDQSAQRRAQAIPESLRYLQSEATMVAGMIEAAERIADALVLPRFCAPELEALNSVLDAVRQRAAQLADGLDKAARFTGGSTEGGSNG